MIAQVLTLCQWKLLELFFIALKIGLVFEYLITCEHFECIIARLTTRHSSTSTFLDMLLAKRRAKEDMIHLEMAAIIDGGSIFRNILSGKGQCVYICSHCLHSLTSLDGIMLMLIEGLVQSSKPRHKLAQKVNAS